MAIAGLACRCLFHQQQVNAGDGRFCKGVYMALTKEDILNIAMDSLGEGEIVSADNPRTELQRRAVRNYDRALIHVLESGPFDDVRQEEIIPISGAAQSSGFQNPLSIEAALFFATEGRGVTQQGLTSRQLRYRNTSFLPVNYGGHVWHINESSKGWKVRRAESGGRAQLLHNYGGAVRVVYNRMAEPADLGEALAQCVGLKIAARIAPQKSGRQTIKRDLEEEYTRTVLHAYSKDQGGDFQPLGSRWLDHAQTGFYDEDELYTDIGGV